MCYDVGRFAVEKVRRDEAWVVGSVVPDQRAQSVVPSWRMGEDGLPVTPAQPPLPSGLQPMPEQYAATGGVIEVAETLGAPPDRPVRWNKREETGGNLRPTGVAAGWAERIYSVYRPPGAEHVICRVNDGYPGHDRIAPVILIPAEWPRFVAPAVEYARDHRADFVAPKGAAGANGADARKEWAARWTALLRDANPFLAVAALRALAEADAIAPADAVAAIAAAGPADPVRQGAMTYALLRLGPAAAWPSRVDALAKAVDAAPDFLAVRGVALGLRAAYPANEQFVYFAEGRPVARAVIRKAEADRSPSQPDATMLENLRDYVRERRSPFKIPPKGDKK